VLRLEDGTPVGDALLPRISVYHSGIGIPAAQRSMSLQRLTQADPFTTRKPGGTATQGEGKRCPEAGLPQGFGLRFAAPRIRDGLPAVSPP